MTTHSMPSLGTHSCRSGSARRVGGIARAGFLLLSAAGITSQLGAQSGSQKSVVVTQRRFAADSFWTREWFRGAAKEPDLFTEPRQVVAASDIVVVLDVGLREVSVFDARTGVLRLQLAARGEGPGEFKRPSQLVGAGDGFGVLDQATSRLTVFDTQGRFTWDAPISGASGTEGLCVRQDGHIVTKLLGSTNALHTFDSTGRSTSRRSLPWPDPGAKTSALMGFVAGPDTRGTCIVARRYGSEWLVIPRSGAMAKRPYVATHPEATITVKTSAKRRVGNEGTFVRTEFTSADAAVSNAMVVGDTAIVRGGPAERDGYRVLDYYLLPTGRYVYSRRLPAVFIATAAGPGGTFYGTTIGEESGALIAFRTSRERPAKKPVERQPGS